MIFRPEHLITHTRIVGGNKQRVLVVCDAAGSLTDDTFNDLVAAESKWLAVSGVYSETVARVLTPWLISQRRSRTSQAMRQAVIAAFRYPLALPLRAATAINKSVKTSQPNKQRQRQDACLMRQLATNE